MVVIVGKPDPRPAYLRIADDLRSRIVDGTLPPGTRLPSRAQLAREYGVAESVALEAMRLLVSEGFVETRPGSGSYVRRRPQVRRLVRSWYREKRGDSPFRADMAAQGRQGSWESHSETTTAPPVIAERLGVPPGEPVMRTNYVFYADGEPVMLSTSYEPLTITRNTPIVLPEEGPYAGKGVVERMAAIGVNVTHAAEAVTARPVLASEAELLKVPTGTTIIRIARTYYADERAVETADITIPADRYEIIYHIPVGD
ncbi:GntR family transcriptional regulator [Carbonactinospora thermoautotrophica]|uniref:Putative gntR-family regulatory protein n=1 Tax=Carbonactinospora thermoautotrophica TaxID=1469144 RepID=A0A132MY30_9ACTN|nr:GntR family transcriptional regulator [Carbonactinospora thermoautotrophica]KWX02805.1 putative gntR-family regulatory protein [Carbonactinospora thermoautotrophica]